MDFRTGGYGIGRRGLLQGAAALFAMAIAAARAGAGARLGPPAPFSFDGLTERARGLAAKPYAAPARPALALVEQIDYDAHGRLRFRPERALFAEGPGVYPVTFFHLGRYFPKPVRMFVVEGGLARERRYDPADFAMPEDSVARGLPADAGFAGFRLQESRNRADWRSQDWAAFLGASYFRAIGDQGQYGLSARGIALDTGSAGAEEFPDFVAFYIAPALREGDPVLVHALLDGPSLAGAYRFALRRTAGVVMEAEARLFLRRDVERLGIAPLTSMYWYAEHDRRHGLDWRPEVHDSDGLAIWNGKGERLWRPLNNPPRVAISSFSDQGPRGFGLLQRDRDPEHYLDGVNFQRRPSLWVEPLDDWGRGAVQLVEIPTRHEISDNIVAFWVAEAPARAGATRRYRYRLHWLADQPYPDTSLARCVALRQGLAAEERGERGIRRFVVEFAGGPVEALAPDAEVVLELSASRGKVDRVVAEPVPATCRWRGRFDLEAGGDAPLELRATLMRGGRAISETWLYQYWPGAQG